MRSRAVAAPDLAQRNLVDVQLGLALIRQAWRARRAVEQDRAVTRLKRCKTFRNRDGRKPGLAIRCYKAAVFGHGQKQAEILDQYYAAFPNYHFALRPFICEFLHFI